MEEGYIFNVKIGTGEGPTDTFETFEVRSNIPQSSLLDAYAKGVGVVGVDIREVLDNGNLLSKEEVEKFKLLGFDFDTESFEDDEDGEGGYYIYVKSYLDLFLFTVRAGNSDISIHAVDDEENPSVYIGGFETV